MLYYKCIWRKLLFSNWSFDPIETLHIAPEAVATVLEINLRRLVAENGFLANKARVRVTLGQVDSDSIQVFETREVKQG